MFIPNNVQFILDKFKENNYEAFIVGGSVRDSLLNRPVNDYDITTNALPEVTEKLFNKTIPTGIKHGTITVLINKESFEVTTYRIDGNYIGNRRPEEVIFVTDIEKDLSRRDFTINALAYNPILGLIDYFNSEKDLKEKIIRAVGIADLRFKEDALRILRAIRFSAQLDFQIEEKTLVALKENSYLISRISKERIKEELTKMFLSNNISKAINLLINCNLIEYIFEDINLKTSISSINSSLDYIDLLEKDITITFGDFLFSIYNGNLISIEKALKNLKFDNLTIKNTITVLTYKNSFKNIKSRKDLKKLIFLTNIFTLKKIFNYNKIEFKKNSEDLNSFLSLLNEIEKNKEPLYLKDLNITGKDLISNLNLKGQIIGELLNKLLDLVLDNPSLNTKENLLKMAKTLV
ncbi:MAG: CCA tRNA nucleotidyltransferase [Sarcina sp.]